MQQTHDFWWTWGQKKNRKEIVNLHGPHTTIAKLLLAARSVPVKLQGYCTVILQQPHHGRAVALRWATLFSNGYITSAILAVFHHLFQFLAHIAPVAAWGFGSSIFFNFNVNFNLFLMTQNIVIVKWIVHDIQINYGIHMININSMNFLKHISKRDNLT